MTSNQEHKGSGDNVGRDKTETHVHHYPEGYQKPIGLDSPKIQVSKLPHTNNQLFGREDELAMLDAAWDSPRTNILTIKAMGGSGKTALMKTWMGNLARDDFRGANAVYTDSFYLQGFSENTQASADEFFDATLQWFGYQGELIPSAHDKGLKLAELINQQRSLILLDGLEPLQYPPGGAMGGALRDQGLKTLFQQLAAQNKGLLVILHVRILLS
ncbi:MAG: ATP-binding protein [Methylococcales bacterium]